MLLEEIGYVIETVSIFGRTTAVVRALVNCYAPTIIQTYDTPSSFFIVFYIIRCSQNECLFQMLAPSKSSRYLATASEISLILINSSAEWEREDSPGPNLKDGKCIRAWSLRVGLPNGFMPMATHFLIRGCAGSMRDDFRRKLWAFTSLFRCWQINL